MLVLPPIVCGLDRFWAPHNGTIPGSRTLLPIDPCPADHVLDLEHIARTRKLEEFVREHYIDIGHHEALYDARERGIEEPPIPALPQEMVDRTAQLYASMYERLTGAEF